MLQIKVQYSISRYFKFRPIKCGFQFLNVFLFHLQLWPLYCPKTLKVRIIPTPNVHSTTNTHVDKLFLVEDDEIYMGNLLEKVANQIEQMGVTGKLLPMANFTTDPIE